MIITKLDSLLKIPHPSLPTAILVAPQQIK